MRTNIDIDDELMASALTAGPYKTKKDAVEAGLKMITRQAAYREILKWRGKLHWDGEAFSDVDLPDAAPVTRRVVKKPVAAKRVTTGAGHGRR